MQFSGVIRSIDSPAKLPEFRIQPSSLIIALRFRVAPREGYNSPYLLWLLQGLNGLTQCLEQCLVLSIYYKDGIDDAGGDGDVRTLHS